MNLWQQFIRPTSVSEAVLALKSSPGPAIPLAGGTDILLDLEQGRHPPVHTLVDVTAVPEMNALELRDGVLFVGAAMPLNRVARHPLTAQHAQALVEACDLVGGPQVRNVATLGGNVAHALPAADGTIALLALGAEAEIANSIGTWRVPFKDLFTGPGKSVLKHGEELLVGFHIPVTSSPHAASCFKRIMRPQGVALPIINLAIWLVRVRYAVREIRLAVGPGGATPFRATLAEEFLCGRELTSQVVQQALEQLLAQINFRTSPRRASAEYRQHLVDSLFQDTLGTVWERAASSPSAPFSGLPSLEPVDRSAGHS